MIILFYINNTYYNNMDLLDFAEKKWYYINWFLNKSLKEIQKEFKQNEKNKKKFFTLKDKKREWLNLTHQEEIDLKFKLNNIIW